MINSYTIGRKEKNSSFTTLFLLLISGKVVLEFLSALLGSYFNISSTRLLSIALYGILFVLMCYMILRYFNQIKKASIVWVLIAWFFYFLCYLISNESVKTLFFSESMIIMYLFYIPFSFLIISNISSFTFMSDASRRMIFIDLIIGAIASVISVLNLATRLTTNSNYMVFSYAVLPIIGLGFYISSRKKNLPIFVLSLLNTGLMLLYGSRMCFLIAFVSLIVCYFNKAKVFSRTVCLLLLILFIYFLLGTSFSAEFQDAIERIKEMTNSHIIKNILGGSFFSLGDRQTIFDKCSSAIFQMGTKVYGPFYDRLLLGNLSTYSHNIVLESLISFGWVFGLLFLMMLLILILRALFNSHKQKQLTLFTVLFLSFFAKFIISSSFMTDSYFVIFVGILITFCRMSANYEMVKHKGSNVILVGDNFA